MISDLIYFCRLSNHGHLSSCNPWDWLAEYHSLFLFFLLLHVPFKILSTLEEKSTEQNFRNVFLYISYFYQIYIHMNCHCQHGVTQ